MFRRTLGRSAIETSAMGLGCWAIGGVFWRGQRGVGWSTVDDDESVRAVHRALDLGVTLFDTADVYGCGHSEKVLGRAIKGRRDDVVIATKFGTTFDPETRQAGDGRADPEYVRQACEQSLRRLGTDVIDLYQFHRGDWDLETAPQVRDVLEDLVAEGKIRWYGWSTDDPQRARLFAQGTHCTAVQQKLNVLEGSLDTLAVCEELNLASINRTCLGMGLLTGKFDRQTTFPKDDVRHGWDFTEGLRARQLEALRRIRRALTAGGRTLAQGALGWLWARSKVTVPIPGFKTVEQVEENVAAMQLGPLADEQMQQIDEALHF
jgi:aryl-alcohol dehydrogenase-like predicted oxidoreductase